MEEERKSIYGEVRIAVDISGLEVPLACSGRERYDRRSQ